MGFDKTEKSEIEAGDVIRIMVNNKMGNSYRNFDLRQAYVFHSLKYDRIDDVVEAVEREIPILNNQ